MFVPSERDVYSWKVPDAEFGELMQGHLYLMQDEYLLIDPPLMPDLLEKLQVFGKCAGVVMLGPSHKRGVGLASAILQAPLNVPEFASDIFSPEPANLKTYKEGDVLPGGLKAVELQTDMGIFGEHKVHEMALLDGKGRVFIGDICHGYNGGELALAPEDIFPGYTDDQVKSSLRAIVEKIPGNIKSGFFGHGDDIIGSFGSEIERRKKEFNL